VVEEADETAAAEDIPRGPKGGRKHKKPGKGHQRKSEGPKKRRFQRKMAKKRERGQKELQKQWEEWEALPPDVQDMRPELRPRGPRPTDDN
jgi:hypothetical protein